VAVKWFAEKSFLDAIGEGILQVRMFV
jgi:hypothetical protein